MYLSVAQEDRLRTIVLGFEIPFRSYVSEVIISTYANATQFKNALTSKVAALTGADSKSKIDNTKRIHGNAQKLYVKIQECYTAYKNGGIVEETEIDVLYVSDLIWSIIIFPELFPDLYSLFQNDAVLVDYLNKYYFVRNKLSHPACIKIEKTYQDAVLSFIIEACDYLEGINEKLFWVKSQKDIKKEILALQTIDESIPIPIHNIYDMPFPNAQVVCRETEIDDIKKFVYGIRGALRKNASYCITGYGGVGKTALVLESIKSIIKDVQDGTTINSYKPDFILFFSAKEEKLDISITSGNILQKPVKKQFSNLTELQQCIFGALGIDSFEAYQKCGIIVVDNLESLSADERKYVKEFIQFMSPPGVQYIVTSRNEEDFDEVKLIDGFEKDSGHKFVTEYISENNLNVELAYEQVEKVLELSRGNTLVLVLSLRRLSRNLITIDGLVSDYSRAATMSKVESELKAIPVNGYEIIGEFMFKNTFLEIEKIFAENSELMYSVLKIFAVCSQDSIDVYTISILLKKNYIVLQPVISLLCQYLILETDGEEYILNRFAEKYIVQRFLPDAEAFLKISTDIENSVRDIRRELESLNKNIQTNNNLRSILEDWCIVNTGDRIAAAKIYHQFQEIQSEVRRGVKFFFQNAVDEAIRIIADVEKTTMHPYIKYQKARILQLVDDSKILTERYTDDIFTSYREAIWVIKTNPIYAKIRYTKSYASVLWLFGSRLYDEDSKSEEALRYLEEATNCFEQLNDESKQYYQCLTRLGFSLLMQYRKDPKTNLSHLRKSRIVSNKLYTDRNNYIYDRTTKLHATRLRNELQLHGKF